MLAGGAPALQMNGSQSLCFCLVLLLGRHRGRPSSYSSADYITIKVPSSDQSFVRVRDYFFAGSSIEASAMHSHLPLRSIQVSTQPKERWNCLPALSLPFSVEVPRTVARFGA